MRAVRDVQSFLALQSASLPLNSHADWSRQYLLKDPPAVFAWNLKVIFTIYKELIYYHIYYISIDVGFGSCICRCFAYIMRMMDGFQVPCLASMRLTTRRVIVWDG